MNLLIAGDAAFLPGIELTLASLACCNPQADRLDVALVNLGFDPALGDQLAKRLQRKDDRYKITILNSGRTVWQGFKPPRPPGFPHSEDRLLKPYQWLAALEQLVSWSEVLVLDGDLLVTTCLQPVLDAARNGLPAAACQDAGHRLSHDCPDPDVVRLHGTDPYFNSGLVWIDLDRWRSLGRFQSVLTFIQKFAGKIRQEDQTVFNGVFAGEVTALSRQFNLSHEALGHLETPANQRLPWQGYIWHLWRQYKPWLGFNYMESGALWYGLHEAWHGRQSPRYHTTRPGYGRTVMRMRHPRLAALYHRLRGHSEMAGFWTQRTREGSGRGNWAARFDDRVDQAADWWGARLRDLRGKLPKGTERGASGHR